MIAKRIAKRNTSKVELDEVIDYWLSRPRGSGYRDEESLIRFLQVFTPHQIKGAMFIATAKGHKNYFRYMCGILHRWRRELEEGQEPAFFDIGDESKGSDG